MTCANDIKGSIPCETTVEQHRQIAVGLLPRGYAWRAANEPGKVQYGYWRAIARSLKRFTDDVCYLANELFCSTRDVLDPDYLREFNLPDPCSPFLSPCSYRITDSAKCEDLVEVLEAMGWSTSCDAIESFSSCGCAVSGCGAVSSPVPLPKRVVITVDTGSSPIFTPTASSASGLASCGCSVSGCESVAPGTIGGLRCVIDRFLPAHIGYNLVVA